MNEKQKRKLSQWVKENEENKNFDDYFLKKAINFNPFSIHCKKQLAQKNLYIRGKEILNDCPSHKKTKTKFKITGFRFCRCSDCDYLEQQCFMMYGIEGHVFWRKI